MREILNAEQPCVLCGSLLSIVTWYLDECSGEEEIRREEIPHPTQECTRLLKLYREEWPPSAVGSS
jgi:hypothetical protein